MIPANSQDPEVVKYCDEFDAYLNFVNQTEQDLQVKVSYEVEIDLLIISVNSTFPAISEVALKSKKYKARSMDFKNETQTLKLETQIEDLDSFDAEVVLILGQEKFSFQVNIDPSNPDAFEDVLELPKKAIKKKSKKTTNQVIDRAVDYNEDIGEIINEYQRPVAVGDVVTLTKHRVGRVCYVGTIDGCVGTYYGIDLFLGKGKHNGCVGNRQYFHARTPKGGLFVREKTIVAFGICGGDATLKPRMTGVCRPDMHGLMVQHNWEDPIQVVTCEAENRPGYDGCMPSHEYRDHPRTMQKKVALLAQIIRKSKNCMAYTGAGISTTAGIDDYASKKTGKKSKINDKRAKVKKPRYAKPTLGHRVLTELYHQGHMKHWVQQNHDGLPQKAGYPQHEINEIHGAWWDVSNTVVPMSGSLRDDLFDWMCGWQNKTDLCLTMGTSLVGMNADKCVEKPAKKYRYGQEGLGSVIIGLQRTKLDEMSSIRFYGTIDEIVSLLAREMNLTIVPYKTLVPDIPEGVQIEEYVFKVPYNADGELTTNPDDMIIWDLRQGKKVVIAIGSGKGFEGTINGFYPETPHLAIATLRQYQDKNFGKQKRTYYMGNWWIETITKGLWHTIPFVNKDLVLQKDFEEK